MLTRKVVWSLALVGSMAALVTRFAPEGKSQPAVSDAPAAMRDSLAGTGSCSARGCHGGFQRDAPVPPQRVCLDEFPRWLLHDKHASAYDVLRTDTSRIMKEKLGLKNRAHEEPRCLACHTNPRAAPLEAGPLLKEERLFGVGCESCHGSASNWLTEHTTPEWRRKNPEEKWAMGMFPVGTLEKRAVLCAGCHIGAPPDVHGTPARDMNHDLIAAGHPRLDFEFGAYSANMPAHWYVDPKRKDGSAQAWLVGQVASAEAAARLLAYRAGHGPGTKDFTRPWPELSEHDCFACHHDLTAQSWRQKRGYGAVRAGALPWGTWHLGLPGALAKQQRKDAVARLLNDLRQEMRAPLPKKGKVVKLATDLASELQKWQVQLALRPVAASEPLTWLREIAERAPQEPVASWESAAQYYLAMAALHQAGDDGKTEAELKELYQEVALPRDFNPKGVAAKLLKLLGRPK